MNIILVCIDNFQEYILTNIKQLIRLEHTNIHIITNKRFESYFSTYLGKLKLYFVENEENDSFQFHYKCGLTNYFKEGFWKLTSYRFFIIYEIMRKYNITNVIHLENDVLIYYNCDMIRNKFDSNFIYLPFDSFERNIASIMYIPTYNILGDVLKEYDCNINDMQNFRNIQLKTNLIHHFPIFVTSSINEEFQFVTQNYDTFKMIFDAAAIGQFLGGVDPNNKAGNTVGFINETCVIKYNQYTILWRNIDNVNKPFLVYEDTEIPIFNLHIHCKDLEKFI